MNSLQLRGNLYWVGIQDFEIEVFDVIMKTKYGSSFNSYILKGSEKTVLFETEKSKHFDEYLKHITQVCPIEKIDYIIMNHTEPDHADGINELLKLNPNIVVYGTANAIRFLKQITNRDDFNAVTVKDKEVLSLGDITLEFNVLPFLHWPDTMWTYSPEIKALFPCDGFGCHYATEEIVRSKVKNEETYWESVKYYYDCIMSPFAQPFVQNAMKRIEGKEIEMICTGHGPVIDSHVDEVIAKYKEWSTVNKNEVPTVVIPYVSAYGYTEQLAQAICSGIQAFGNFSVKLYDMVTADAEEVIAEVEKADAILLGSPTIVGDALPPIWNILANMHAQTCRGKLAAAFGSTGWSGEAVPNLTERMKQLKLKVQDGFTVSFKPSDADLEAAKEYGKNFASLI